MAHPAKHDQDARRVQPRREDHPDEKRKVGADVAERAGELVAVKTNARLVSIAYVPSPLLRYSTAAVGW